MIVPVSITLTVNQERIEAMVPPRLNLADFLRDHLSLTGTHIGCEHGVCGACTVRVNGDIVRSCLMLAIQAEGAVVETIEGLSDTGEIAEPGRHALFLECSQQEDFAWTTPTTGATWRARRGTAAVSW